MYNVHRITSAIRRKLAFALSNEQQYFHQQSLAQDLLFQQQQLDRPTALKHIRDICEKVLGYSYDETNGMFSEHLVLLAALSLRQQPAQKILEIGTHDGRCASLLATLFPDAEIITIDLPSTDTDFQQFYHRENSYDEFVRIRNERIAPLSNITFVERNSIDLINWESESFDIIWVDGAHGYPVVALDLLNAWRLIRPGGSILIDDVYTCGDDSDRMYKSTASFETMNALKQASIINDFTLFRKRLGLKFNIDAATEKYVARIQKLP